VVGSINGDYSKKEGARVGARQLVGGLGIGGVGERKGVRTNFPGLRGPFGRLRDHLSHRKFLASLNYPLPEALEGSIKATKRQQFRCDWMCVARD